MRKIPTALERDRQSGKVTGVPDPRCGWVFAGLGEPRRKLDGACARVADGRLWRRATYKTGGPVPDGFELAEEDPNTGKRFGWVPVSDTDPADRWFREARYAEFDPFERRVKVPPFWGPSLFGILEDGQAVCPGTFELIGPKVNGGEPDITGTTGLHLLVRHATTETLWDTVRDCPAWPIGWPLGGWPVGDPVDGAALIRWFRRWVPAHWEGVVWTHPDGRMAKLKWRDLGPQRDT